MKIETRAHYWEEINRMGLLLSNNENYSYGIWKDMDNVYHFEENRFAVYNRDLSNEDIHHIIRAETNENFPELFAELKGSVPNIKSKLVITFDFIKIRYAQEQNLMISLRDSREERIEFWDVWGVLDDGTILNPEHTEPLFREYIDRKRDVPLITT
jgi:hypothetical protein